MGKNVVRMLAIALGAWSGIGSAVAESQETVGPIVMPLVAPVLAGKPVALAARGRAPLEWDFGDGSMGRGASVRSHL